MAQSWAARSLLALRSGANSAGLARHCSSLPVPAQGAEAETQSHIPGVKQGGEKFVMLFTCSVCDTRSAKVISKTAYTSGVVLAKCPGCDNNHLIADHLGWFEDDSVDVESLMAAKGQSVTKAEFDATGGVLELSQEDLAILGTGKPSLGSKATAAAAQAEEEPASDRS